MATAAASDQENGVKQASKPLTLRAQQMREQQAIRNASLGPDEKHLATTYADTTELVLPENSTGDPFGKNDNNRRVAARLAAMKEDASGPRVKPTQLAVNEDSQYSDVINPTVGEKLHEERNVAVAQLTNQAVVDNKPVSKPLATPATPKNATGQPATPAQAAAQSEVKPPSGWGK